MGNERVDFIYKLLIILTSVYLLINLPHIPLNTLIAIYNKEINKLLKEQYGKGNNLPTNKNTPPHKKRQSQETKPARGQSAGQRGE